MNKKSIVLALCLSVAVSAFAQFAPEQRAVNASESAASKPAVEVKLVQKKVVIGDKGVEQLADADTARPNDVIEYQATYTNRSDKAVSQVVANLPLPEGLEYVPRSAKPAQGVKLSAQDRQFGTEPLSRKSATGKTEPVPYNEYRDVRWTIGQIPPGKSVTVSARARVEAVRQPGTSPVSASDEANSNVEIELAGGTLNLGPYVHSIGKLTVSAASILDFDAGTASLSSTNLNVTATGTTQALTVNNWTRGTDVFQASQINGGTTTARSTVSLDPLNRIKLGGASAVNTLWTAITANPQNEITTGLATVKVQKITVPGDLGACTMNTPANPAPAAAVDCATVQPVGGTGAIRWLFDGRLNPGASGDVGFRVKVE